MRATFNHPALGTNKPDRRRLCLRNVVSAGARDVMQESPESHGTLGKTLQRGYVDSERTSYMEQTSCMEQNIGYAV